MPLQEMSLIGIRNSGAANRGPCQTGLHLDASPRSFKLRGESPGRQTRCGLALFGVRNRPPSETGCGGLVKCGNGSRRGLLEGERRAQGGRDNKRCEHLTIAVEASARRETHLLYSIWTVLPFIFRIPNATGLAKQIIMNSPRP